MFSADQEQMVYCWDECTYSVDHFGYCSGRDFREKTANVLWRDNQFELVAKFHNLPLLRVFVCWFWWRRNRRFQRFFSCFPIRELLYYNYFLLNLITIFRNTGTLNLSKRTWSWCFMAVTYPKYGMPWRVLLKFCDFNKLIISKPNLISPWNLFKEHRGRYWCNRHESR